jgi:hypothetical protein
MGVDDLIGYAFKVEQGDAVVTGPSLSSGYVTIEITDEKGMKSESLRVEAQVRRARELTQMSRTEEEDDPNTDTWEDEGGA